MKPASVKELKDELKFKTKEELQDYCIRLAKFKKENKELFTYLLFDASDEEAYIGKVKAEIIVQFEAINQRNYYFVKKSVRKILKETKKYIRYSGKKETEVEILLFFCLKLKEMRPDYRREPVLKNTFNRQVSLIENRLKNLHEDLQYDFQKELDLLRGS